MRPSRLALRAALPLALTLCVACGGEEAETSADADTAAVAAAESTAVVTATLATCEPRTVTSATKTIPATEDHIELTGAGIREVRVTYHAKKGATNRRHKVEAVSTAGDIDATHASGRRMTIAIDTTGCTGSGTFHIYRVTGAALHKLTDTPAHKASMIAGIHDPGTFDESDTTRVAPPRFAVGTE